jgi:hypothetical protein
MTFDNDLGDPQGYLETRPAALEALDELEAEISAISAIKLVVREAVGLWRVDGISDLEIGAMLSRSMVYQIIEAGLDPETSEMLAMALLGALSRTGVRS